METSHLSPDEFVIECVVRKITGHPSDVLETIRGAWQFERDNPVVRPSQMHIAASKNPVREINSCISRLKELEDQLGKREMHEDEDLKKIRSRLLHLEGRFYRASSSPKHGDKAKIALKSVERVIDTVNELLEGSLDLDATLDSLKDLKISDMPLLEEGENPIVDPLPQIFDYSKRKPSVLTVKKTDISPGAGTSAEIILSDSKNPATSVEGNGETGQNIDESQEVPSQPQRPPLLTAIQEAHKRCVSDFVIRGYDK